MRIWKQAAISLLLLAVAGVLWARHLPAGAALLERAGFPVNTAAPPEASSTPGRGTTGPGPLVRGVEVAEARIDDEVTAIGDGHAARSVTLTPSVAGRVAAIEVAAGKFVRAGQPILRLDFDTESIAVDRARLVLDDARTTAERNERLKELRRRQRGAAPRGGARGAAGRARAARRRPRARAAGIEAPFGGFVGILAGRARRPGRHRYRDRDAR